LDEKRNRDTKLNSVAVMLCLALSDDDDDIIIVIIIISCSVSEIGLEGL